MEKKKWLKVPHPYVLVVLLIILSTVLTYIIPSGIYDRAKDETTGRTLVVPSTFHFVEQTPVSPASMVMAIPAGMVEVAWIVSLIFIIGGSFGIINATGAIEAGLGASINKLKGKDKTLLAGITFIFSLGGATFGMAESTLIFIPIGVMLARALGYDAIVGMAIINIGAICGFAAGWLNVFTVGVAQGIAGLPLFSGMGYRMVTHVVVLTIAIIYIIAYASKIKKNPELSLVADLEKDALSENINVNKIAEFTPRRKLVLLAVLIGFIVLIYGITNGWSTSTQISSLFLVLGVVCGFIGGMDSTDIANAFIGGAKALTFGALLVGLCRAMVVILTDGQIIDTTLHSLSSLLNGLPPVIAAGLMVPFQLFVNLFINSGSGQAATTMPIMAPLADILGFSRQTAVLAFQYGDGLSNSLWPTSGVLMASLSIANIPYDKWVKWVWKLLVYLYIAVTILTMLSVVIGYE
ncbi:MAG: YfcC family protein [Synergistaceae bacterium]|nr:YfcC family protein [Synergistaceae bacterium]MBP9957413.1 YfcC family protein [Synergistaceae bacterium]